MLTPIPTNRVASEWPRLVDLLRPAIEGDDSSDTWGALGRLLSGEVTAWDATTDGGSGVVITATGRTKGRRVRALWVVYAAGAARGGPRRRVAALRSVLRELEVVARTLRCKEIRVEDRAAWRRVLDDYSVSHKPNGGILLRKAL